MSIVKGVPISYLSFDGVNDYVSFNNRFTEINKNSDFKIELEIKFLRFGPNQETYFTTANGSSDRWSFHYNQTTDRLVFTNYPGSFPANAAGIDVSSNNIQTGVWYNVTLEYINGTVFGDISGTSWQSGTDDYGSVQGDFPNPKLGARLDSADLNGNFEIRQLNIYNGSNVLTHEYNFDEGSGTTLTDSVGNNDGTIVGATWQIEDNAIQNIYYGRTSYLTFDGVDDYVDIDVPTVDIADGYSLTVKVNFNSLGNNIKGLINLDYDSDRYWQFRIDPDNTVRFIRFDSSNNIVANFISTQTVTTNTDYWITATFDNVNGSKIYLDGVEIESDPNTTNNNSGNISYPIRLGGYYRQSGDPGFPSIDDFDGIMYNAQIWNKALTSTEINNYISNLPMGNETDLFAYYDFQDGSGTTLTDKAGNNDGTIIGATWNGEGVPVPRIYLGQTLVYGSPPLIDLQNFSYSNTQNTLDDNTYNFDFNNDGTKLYIVTQNENDIREYDLSTPYDISTATFNVEVSLNSSGTITGFHFTDNGSLLFVIDFSNDQIDKYELSSPYDLSSINNIATQSFSVAPYDLYPNDLYFVENGSKMYFTGRNQNKIWEFTLTTPYDLNTLTNTHDFSVQAQEDRVHAMEISNNGTQIFISGNDIEINVYSLSTPFELNTASFDYSFDLSNEMNSLWGFKFNNNENKLFALSWNDGTNAIIYEYE